MQTTACAQLCELQRFFSAAWYLRVSMVYVSGILQVHDFLPVPPGILNLIPGALADIPARVDDIDGIGHVDLALMHIIQHHFHPVSPDFIVTGMSEQADADDDVPFKGQLLLRLKELLFEAGTAAQGDDFVFADHLNVFHSYKATNSL